MARHDPTTSRHDDRTSPTPAPITDTPDTKETTMIERTAHDPTRRSLARSAARTLLAAPLALLAAAPALAQYENKAEGVSKDQVLVGTSVALSGTLAYMGKAIEEGMHVYFESVNQQGGVNGRRIKLVTYDDEFKPAKTVANAKLLVERDNAMALVGVLGTPTVLAAYEYLQEKKVPMIGALSISDAVSTPPRDLIYALPSPQSTEAAAYIDHAVKGLNAKRVAILYQNDSWGKPAMEVAEKRLATHGLKPVETQTFERLATDLTSQVFKLKESNPDVVVVYALGQQAASFFKSAEKLGWNPTVFGAGGLNDPKFVELLDGKPVKLYVASYYDAIDGENPAITSFVAAYGKLYAGSKPSALALMGYSAAAVFTEALRRAGAEPTRAKLIGAMDGLKGFDQRIGPKITFEPLGGSPYSRRGQTGVVLMELKGQKFVSMGSYIDPVTR
jgi:ABC-type branched-subunit amino acid transport system substrate-binding protein